MHINPMTSLLAAVVLSTGGGGIISGLLWLLLVCICLGLIYWVGTWFIGKIGAPAIALTVWQGIFILLGLVIVINFVMGLGGHSFISW